MAGASGQACAACKHQRRKCHPDCALARYFPAERAREFQGVHRLFGLSNLMKFYNAAPPHQRDHLIASMAYEAEMRRRQPVLGCVAVIRELCALLDAALRDLDAARHQLELCKRAAILQQQQAFLVPHQSLPLLSPPQDLASYKQPPPPVSVNMASGEVAVGNMKTEDVGASSHLPLPSELQDVKPLDRVVLDHAMELLHQNDDVRHPQNTEESSKELKVQAAKSDGAH